MKFLVVNDLGQSEISKRSFEKFTTFVTKSLFWDKSTCDDDTQIVSIKNQDDLTDYLFDIDAGFGTTDSAKRFDVMDAVFIVSSSHKVPWSKSNEKVLFFI